MVSIQKGVGKCNRRVGVSNLPLGVLCPFEAFRELVCDISAAFSHVSVHGWCHVWTLLMEFSSVVLSSAHFPGLV